MIEIKEDEITNTSALEEFCKYYKSLGFTIALDDFMTCLQDEPLALENFKQLPEKEQKSYDLVTSNIPFGDTSIFDLSYSRSTDSARVQAARSIHNYFFLKGGDMLREGGILAFITSQGVLNSPSNIAIREALMKDHKLVSAIRLPNNLFC